MKKLVHGFFNGVGMLLCIFGVLSMLCGIGFSAFFFTLFALSFMPLTWKLVDKYLGRRFKG